MADGKHRLKLKSSGNDGHFMPADATSEVNKNATTRKEPGQLANGPVVEQVSNLLALPSGTSKPAATLKFPDFSHT
jgi:hypothetical protein